MPVVLERVVNATTFGSQVGSNVEALADGGWIVSWRGSANPFSGVFDVFFQRYSADGIPVGGETIANTTRGDLLDQPVTTALADGGWVISWAYHNGVDGFWNIWHQRYDANGQPVGGRGHGQYACTGAAGYARHFGLADGGWITVWQSYDQNGQYLGVYQQRFGADGQRVGTETHVSTGGISNIDPVVTSLADGGWIVAWSYSGLDSTSRQIYSQRYDALGVAIGAPTQVSTFQGANLGVISEPAVAALSDGGWVISWTTAGQDSLSSDGVFLQRFAADGTPFGSETQVNVSFAYEDQDRSSLLALPDGGWLVFWTSETSIGGDLDIYARRFLSMAWLMAMTLPSTPTRHTASSTRMPTFLKMAVWSSAGPADTTVNLPRSTLTSAAGMTETPTELSSFGPRSPRSGRVLMAMTPCPPSGRTKSSSGSRAMTTSWEVAGPTV